MPALFNIIIKLNALKKKHIGIWEIGMWVGEECNLPFCSCYDNGDELLNNGLKGSLLAIGNSIELHH
jgi:hypothetical protein